MKIWEWLFRNLFRAKYLALCAATAELDLCKGSIKVYVQLANEKTELAITLQRELREKTEQVEVLKRTNETIHSAFRRLEAKTEAARKRPVARFQMQGGLSAEDIAQRLAGQEKTPVILAIVAHLGAKVVELCDKSTEAPRGQAVLRDGTVVPGFSETERLHTCGKADGVAEILAELQEMAAPQPETEGEEKK